MLPSTVEGGRATRTHSEGYQHTSGRCARRQCAVTRSMPGRVTPAKERRRPSATSVMTNVA
jgi:hypothetical protein